ncbi:ACC1 [Symbiodinium necroappetens]|uniref:ACC1 protein n=1 Tax=Symbiodinium necroappetens TaxID=1628268 RepID=A0A813AQN8_9DINO|nr:ACC1 [Symbiodinium necroappetens]
MPEDYSIPPQARCLKQAAKSLLTAPLSSSGQWQSDHGDAESVLKLCSRGEAQSLLIVPQASLVCKLELGDRNLKYHQQCPRDTAATLPRTEPSARVPESRVGGTWNSVLRPSLLCPQPDHPISFCGKLFCCQNRLHRKHKDLAAQTGNESMCF